MDNKEADLLAVLARVSHEKFNIKEYKQTFVKTFLQLCKNQCQSSLERKDTAGLALILYNTLFINRPTTLEPVLNKLSKTLKAPANINSFLSSLFLVFIHQYSRSFFSKPRSWKQFVQVIQALDDIVEISTKQSTQHSQKTATLPPDDLAISALEKIRQAKGSIKVLNTYRSVPIQYKANVVHTSADSVLIKAHSLQDVAASFQGGIYILRDDHFDLDLYASVKRRIVKGHDLLELSRFDQLSTSFHKRQTVRVHPFQSFTIVLRHGDSSFIVTLFDISIGGLAVVSNRSLPIRSGDDVIIRLPAELLEAERPLEVESMFIHRSAFEGGYKYHFQFTLDNAEENSVSKIIVKRQNMIIRDLKEQMI